MKFCSNTITSTMVPVRTNCYPKNVYFLSLTTFGVILFFTNVASLLPLLTAFTQYLGVVENPLMVQTAVNGSENSKEIFARKPSYPWIGDNKCQHFVVQLAKRNTLPKWPLTSFPGSGVTWVRQLIEGVTGIYTGSVYAGDPPPVLLQGNGTDNNTADPLCGCTIIDKDHEATVTTLGMASYFDLLHYQGNAEFQFQQQYGKRGILLLRNPMDVVFAYRNWMGGGKTGKVPLTAFEGPEWEEVIDYVAYAWADHAIRWIEQIEIGTVIFYEALLGKSAHLELERVLNVLDFHPINADRMWCTMSHRNRTDHRRLNKTRMLLGKHHRLKFMKSIHRVQQSLRRKGWPRLPVYLYDVHSPDGNL